MRFWFWSTPRLKKKTRSHSKLPLSAFRLLLSNLNCSARRFQKNPPKRPKPLSRFRPARFFALRRREKPAGLGGDDYRRARAQAAWAIQALSEIIPAEAVDGLDWRWLAEQVARSPENFLAAAGEFAARDAKTPLAGLLSEVADGKIFPRVIGWTLLDARRITLVPPGHWLLIEDSAPFRATLKMRNENTSAVHVQSIAVGDRHVASFAPQALAADAELILERYAATSPKVSATIRFLAPEPAASPFSLQPSALVLLTNGIGGMARLCADLGRVNSKYDCALGANLDPNVPVDRHVFVKRLRVWVNAAGFLSPLDFKNLASFQAGPAAVWNFVANAGDGRTVEIELRAEMIDGENTTVFHFRRPTEKRARGKQLPADADVRLTVRVDIEDRNFHSETKRNGGADYHFSSNTHRLEMENIQHPTGFAFTPAPDRQLRVFRTPANIIRSRNGARTFRIRWSRRAARSAAATPTAPAGLKFRWRKARR